MSDNEIQVNNPLLERLRIPGATYRLPSQGLFYKNGELDSSVVNGEVEVYPMTAMDEIILDTPDKLLSGKAVLEIFEHCIPAIRAPGKLLAKDVDFLMVCLRAVTFGDTIEVQHQHDCEGGLNHTYVVNLQSMINGTKSVDPTTIGQDYTVNLPNGQKVTLRPLSYDKVVDIYQTTMNIKFDQMTEQEAENWAVNALAGIVDNVDGVTDAVFIKQWAMQLPLGWKRQLEQAAKQTSHWGVDFEVQQVCKDCKREFTLYVTANPVSFFS